MTIEEYIANGGSITVCPPRVAVYGFSPMIAKLPEGYEAESPWTFKESIGAHFKQANAEMGHTRRMKLKREYEAGHTIEDIAKREGVTVKRLKEILKSAGCQIASAMRPLAPPHPQSSEMAKDYLAGGSLAVLARKYQTGEKQVRRSLVSLGIEIRPMGIHGSPRK
jgi:hypothetical protein